MDGRLVFAKASGRCSEGLLHSREPARRPRGRQLRSQDDQCENSTKGHQRRLAFVRAELLPTLPAGSAPCGAGRHVHEPSRISMHQTIAALTHHQQSTRESDAMSNRRLNDNPPDTPTASLRTAGWHKRSCAALLSATMLWSLSGPASTPAVAQAPAKPNILFIK